MKWIFLFFLFFTSSLLAQDNRRDQILSVVDQELKEVQRLSSQMGNRDPDLLLRMAELSLEKARLEKERENAYYLQLSPAKRKKANKAQYFKRSTQHFREAQKICQTITTRFKNYKDLSDVYYIMAYNERELGSIKKASQYFALSIKKNKGNSSSKLKSQIALADMYYNDRNYKKAIPLYESSLKNKNEKWWTKDAFNLAWSYFRVKQYSKAISLMQEIYQVSKNDKYIDMSADVVRDIGYFYAKAGQINQAVSFYQQRGIDYSQVLINLAIKLQNDSLFTDAQLVLAQAIKVAKNDTEVAQIRILQLELYDRFGKDSLHLSTARQVLELYNKKILNSEQVEAFRYQIEKKAAERQKQVTGKIYRNLKKVRDKKAMESIEYFSMLAMVSRDKEAETLLLSGETSYATRKYTTAMSYYDQAYQAAERSGNSKIRQQALESMLATLGLKALSSKTKEQFYIPVYTRYLNENPRSSKSASIHQRLFKVYIARKQPENADKVMRSFISNYPQNIKIQEAMLAELMEYHRKNKNNDEIRKYVSEVQAGNIKVSANYQSGLKTLLTNLQMETAQKELAKGNKAQALAGYQAIFKDERSTETAKTNAAYNSAILFYEGGDPQNAYSWSVKSISMMEAGEVKKFEDSYLTISNDLFNRRQFLASADLSHRVLAKICKTRSTNKKTLFQNALYIYLADSQPDKAKQLIDLGTSCQIPNQLIYDGEIELARYFYESQDWVNFESFLTTLIKANRVHPDLVELSGVMHRKFLDLGQTAKAREYMSYSQTFYRNNLRKKQKMSLAALDEIANIELQKMSLLYQEFRAISLAFPENIYAANLDKKIKLLERMTDLANQIQSIGSGHGISRSYRFLYEGYDSLVKEISNYTPPVKDANYIKEFKTQMMSFTKQLDLKNREIVANAKRELLKNQILSADNIWLMSPSNYFTPVFVNDVGAVPMDRRGL